MTGFVAEDGTWAFYHQNGTYYYLIEAGNGRIGTDIFLFRHAGNLLDN